MRLTMSRSFTLGLAVLAVISLNGASSKSQEGIQVNAVPTCLKNDSHVRVQAEIKSVKLDLSEANQLGFLAHAIIRIVNASTEPVLILADDPKLLMRNQPHYGALSLAKTEEDAFSCRYFYNHGAYPSVYRSAAWQKLRKELENDLPSAKYSRTIAPGSAWEFERDIHFGLSNDPMERLIRGKTSLDLVREDPHVWFQVELLMWPDNLETDVLHPQFGMRLQKKWSRSGYLIIENLRTDPVPLDLPTK